MNTRDSGERRRYCVFCGSSPGARPEYAACARTVADALVARGAELVYGGGKVGLMGVVADAVLAAGGRAIGVIPDWLVEREVAHEGLTELRIVRSMHERKAVMADLSQGFIALPGGLGTLEELFEVASWALLGLHAKPCGVVNVAGFYDPLQTMLRHCVAERFLRSAHEEWIIVEPTIETLLDRFDAYELPAGDKIDRLRA